jgi:hypothetical protein
MTNFLFSYVPFEPSFDSQKQLNVPVWIIQSEAPATVEAVVPSKEVVSGGSVEAEDLNLKKD